MSTLKVNTINNDGTNATDATNGFTIGGNSIIQAYTSSGDEPTSPSAGDLWWDSTNSVLKRYINSEWKEVATVEPSVWYGDRGLFAGGSGWSNTIQYVDITQSTGNATDFGDLTSARGERPAGWGDGTYGVFGGGRDGFGTSNVIDYVTVATTGNAVDFGDLSVARRDGGSPTDGIYGLYGGGYNNDSGGDQNAIDYITIATTGNATDFGDLASAARGQMSGNDATYGLFADSTNGIDYVTIQTTGNATPSTESGGQLSIP